MSSVPKPGMITLRNKKTNEISYHFPVDVREIAAANKGVYEIVEDGSMEAARVVSAPLRQALITAIADDNVVSVVQNSPDGVYVITEDQVKLEEKAAKAKGDEPVQSDLDKNIADAKAEQEAKDKAEADKAKPAPAPVADKK